MVGDEVIKQDVPDQAYHSYHIFRGATASAGLAGLIPGERASNLAIYELLQLHRPGTGRGTQHAENLGLTTMTATAHSLEVWHCLILSPNTSCSINYFTYMKLSHVKTTLVGMDSS